MSGLKLLTRLRLNFSHSNEHKFRHNIKYSSNRMCFCSFEPETKDHYFLSSKLFSDLRTDLLNDVFAMNQSLKNISDELLVNILLYMLLKNLDSVQTQNFLDM